MRSLGPSPVRRNCIGEAVDLTGQRRVVDRLAVDGHQRDVVAVGMQQADDGVGGLAGGESGRRCCLPFGSLTPSVVSPPGQLRAGPDAIHRCFSLCPCGSALSARARSVGCWALGSHWPDHDVSVFARGENLDAIRSNGLRLIEPDGSELGGQRSAGIRLTSPTSACKTSSSSP